MSKDCVDAKASKCNAVVGQCRNAVLMMEGKAFKCLQLLSATMYESFAVAGRYIV